MKGEAELLIQLSCEVKLTQRNAPSAQKLNNYLDLCWGFFCLKAFLPASICSLHVNNNNNK